MVDEDSGDYQIPLLPPSSGGTYANHQLVGSMPVDEEPTAPHDYSNVQLVGSMPAHNLVTVIRPKWMMGRTEAVIHAAWLVILAGATPEDFLDVYKRVTEQ